MNRMLRRGSRDLVKFIASLNGQLPKILEQDMAGIQGNRSFFYSSHNLLDKHLESLKLTDGVIKLLHS